MHPLNPIQYGRDKFEDYIKFLRESEDSRIGDKMIKPLRILCDSSNAAYAKLVRNKNPLDFEYNKLSFYEKAKCITIIALGILALIPAIILASIGKGLKSFQAKPINSNRNEFQHYYTPNDPFDDDDDDDEEVELFFI